MNTQANVLALKSDILSRLRIVLMIILFADFCWAAEAEKQFSCKYKIGEASLTCKAPANKEAIEIDYYLAYSTILPSLPKGYQNGQFEKINCRQGLDRMHERVEKLSQLFLERFPTLQKEKLGRAIAAVSIMPREIEVLDIIKTLRVPRQIAEEISVALKGSKEIDWSSAQCH